MESAKVNYRASQLQLTEIMRKQGQLEKELRNLSLDKNNANPSLWKDSWWKDLLSYININNGGRILEKASKNLCTMVKNDLYTLFNGPFDVGRQGFPMFDNIFGLLIALESRKGRRVYQRNAIISVSKLNENPSEGEILENSSCHKCRADWFQTVRIVKKFDRMCSNV